jgi:hypothetical protein
MAFSTRHWEGQIRKTLEDQGVILTGDAGRSQKDFSNRRIFFEGSEKTPEAVDEVAAVPPKGKV